MATGAAGIGVHTHPAPGQRKGPAGSARSLADTQADVLELRLQTDRQRWLGRNHTPAQPQGQVNLPPQPGAAPSDRIGLNTALDPVSVLAVRVRIAPGAKAQLTFATAASLDPGTLHAIIDKYRQHPAMCSAPR